MSERRKVFRARVLAGARSLFKLDLFERLLLRATVGHPYSGFVSKLPPLHTSYPPGTRRQVVRHGCVLDLDLSDLVDWYAFWGFADRAHDELAQRCSAGQVVVDIGANRGITVTRLARIVGPQGRVVAIEADRGNFALLEQRVRENDLTWVTLVNRAVAEEAGVLRISPRVTQNSGMNSIAERGQAIEAATLDAILGEVGVESVDAIKIDVEGYEERVLAGAVRTIAEHRPVVLVEVDDENLGRFGSTRSDLFAKLPGYSLSDASNPGTALEAAHGDVLALPEAS